MRGPLTAGLEATDRLPNHLPPLTNDHHHLPGSTVLALITIPQVILWRLR